MLYASSAATYGDGEKGFNDNIELINSLKPLNGYGYTKHIFDLWTLKQHKKPKQFVGLKFFNVYGPNEYHKGSMASVIFHSFNQVKQKNRIELFKSYRDEYKDGEQKRDFIYVKDIVKVIEFFIQNKEVSGIFNVGTGLARSYNDLAKSVFNALKINENINYINIPQILVDKYQYYTQADISKLRKVGYKEVFYSLENGIYDYIVNYLNSENIYM